MQICNPKNVCYPKKNRNQFPCNHLCLCFFERWKAFVHPMYSICECEQWNTRVLSPVISFKKKSWSWWSRLCKFSSHISCLRIFCSAVRVLKIQCADDLFIPKSSWKIAPEDALYISILFEITETLVRRFINTISSTFLMFSSVVNDYFRLLKILSRVSFYKKNHKHDLVYTQLDRYSLKSCTNLTVSNCEDSAFLDFILISLVTKIHCSVRPDR